MPHIKTRRRGGSNAASASAKFVRIRVAGKSFFGVEKSYLRGEWKVPLAGGLGGSDL